MSTKTERETALSGETLGVYLPANVAGAVRAVAAVAGKKPSTYGREAIEAALRSDGLHPDQQGNLLAVDAMAREVAREVGEERVREALEAALLGEAVA